MDRYLIVIEVQVYSCAKQLSIDLTILKGYQTSTYYNRDKDTCEVHIVEPISRSVTLDEILEDLKSLGYTDVKIVRY